KDAPAAAPAEENVVEAVEAEATDAEVENADAVVEAIEDETATAADAPEAEEAKKD
ncbi:MAG: 50S ribosomal protein L17, partial [Rhodococcus sp. (in: high G+C Gram-positive bacteria)]